jgi:hypothetical protein
MQEPILNNVTTSKQEGENDIRLGQLHANRTRKIKNSKVQKTKQKPRKGETINTWLTY